MLFGKYINKYYLIFSWILLIGIIALILVDLAQLKIPEIYSTIIDGLNGEGTPLTKDILLDLCMDMFGIVFVMVFGRFLWRICFYGSATNVSKRIRLRMFNHAKDLGYQEISVGVDIDNYVALSIYQKYGFDKIIYVGEDEQGKYLKLLKKL